MRSRVPSVVEGLAVGPFGKISEWFQGFAFLVQLLEVVLPGEEAEAVFQVQVITISCRSSRVAC